MPLLLGEADGTRSIEKSVQTRSSSFTILRKVRFTYYVISDGLTDSEDDIFNTSGLPKLFDLVDGKSCTNVSPKEIARTIHPVTSAAAILYAIELEFSNDVGEGEESEEGDDGKPPEDRSPKVEWDSDLIKDTPTKTLLGNPIATATGERIILEEEQPIAIAHITTWQVSPYPPGVILQLVNHVNDGTYKGAPRGSVICRKIRTTPERHTVGNRTILYDKVIAEVAFKLIKNEAGEFKEDTWFPEVLHQGYKYFAPDGTIRVHKVDGEPTKINLAADGTPLAEGADLDYITFTTKGYVDFNSYKTVDGSGTI